MWQKSTQIGQFVAVLDGYTDIRHKEGGVREPTNFQQYTHATKMCFNSYSGCRRLINFH